MKKKAILTLSLVLTYLMSNAQTQKGTQTLGFNLNYNSTTNTRSSTSSYDGSLITQDYKYKGSAISPVYSYFIADRSEIGTSLFYKTSRQNSSYNIIGGNSANSQTTDSYGGSIFFRKYVLFENRFGFRAGPYAGYQHAINKYTSIPVANSSDNNSTTNGYNAGAMFDLVYYPSKKVGITATIANLAYTNDKANSSSPNQVKNENFNFNFIDGLSLSVFYAFGGK
ncbi:MAG: hypothetical protein V4560_18225 [Bacteroidota bacterium]